MASSSVGFRFICSFHLRVDCGCKIAPSRRQDSRVSLGPRPALLQGRSVTPSLGLLVNSGLQMGMLDAVVPWYVAEEIYERFRCTSVDPEVFFTSHSEWLAAATEHERQAEENGGAIVRICMDFAAFERWCESDGARNDVEGRWAFAIYRAQQILPS